MTSNRSPYRAVYAGPDPEALAREDEQLLHALRDAHATDHAETYPGGEQRAYLARVFA